MIPKPDIRWVAVLLGLSLAPWAPRLRGPIDLRYDSGVYYILGTSLMQGRGYRLLNEPGEIRAIQYPPALPALVAAHQWVLGTTDPAVVGWWLRLSSCLMSTLLTLSVYGLSRRYLAPFHAFVVGLSISLSPSLFWLSDLLFAEVPYALVSILFLLAARRGGRRGEATAGLLGVIAFLLRTAGLALLAAWAAEALLTRRWALAALRSAVALVPLVAWQAYVAGVRSGPEYLHPAYTYQRAPYQYYNVSYTENVLLVDPFAPERGHATTRLLAGRFFENLATMPDYLGWGLMGGKKDSRAWLAKQGLTLDMLRARIGLISATTLGLLILAGMGFFLSRREWLIPTYAVGYVGLVCLTPWPGQFNRYIQPLTPLLALAVVRLLAAFGKYTLRDWPGWWRLAGPVCLFALSSLLVGKNAASLVGTYNFESAQRRIAGINRNAFAKNYLFYDQSWIAFDACLSWLEGHANSGAIVATSSPHWVYLRTGLHAVMPPMTPDPSEAQGLLDSVPADYAIADDFTWINTSDTYLEPTIRGNPEKWELVYTTPASETRVYRRVR